MLVWHHHRFWRTPRRGIVVSFLLLFLASAAPVYSQSSSSASNATTPPRIQLWLVDKGFTSPVHITYQPGFPKRLLVVEQEGRIVLVENEVRSKAEPFLDLSDKVESGGEKGLLSIAFHPNYPAKPKMYVNYTAPAPTLLGSKLETIVAEYDVSPETNRPVKSSERVILRIGQPFPNHNGGQIAFGPDRMLYIGMGDGGLRMDPQDNGQNVRALLGKMLRIDVDGRGSEGSAAYAIPADNPFADGARGAPEIWAYGLRNPWRFSFDMETGLLWAGDVGQDREEEIDIIEKGKNYGWDIMEGTICHRLGFECSSGWFESPIVVYGRSEGGSVTGGFVYRGKKFPTFRGWYFYADYLSGRIWGLHYVDGKLLGKSELLKTDHKISTFGQDASGELYLADHVSGEVYQIIEAGQ